MRPAWSCRLLLADFDRDVAAIAAQPFLLQARVGGTARRHVPDFLLAHADKSVRVVNVKPAGKLTEPRIAEALAWPGRLVEAHGWQCETWSGADPVLLANLRFLAGYRRPGLPPDELLDEILWPPAPAAASRRLASGSAAGVQRLRLRDPERRHGGGEQRRQHHPACAAGPAPGDVPGDRGRRLVGATGLPGAGAGVPAARRRRPRVISAGVRGAAP
jgi:hypothetical protein